ncbi:MAG: sigma-70 family RNA polymerase sigma factor [Nitrospirota bacterium]
MKQVVAAVPPEDSILSSGKKEKLYYRILADARRARVYGGWAEDVAHEAWIIATQRGYYHPRMLREAARNLGLWREAATEQLQERICEDDPEKIFEKNQKIQAVRAVLKKLSCRCQLVVFLHFFKGMSLRNIAKMSGENLTAVYACLKQAEAALRVHLADFAPEARRESASGADLPLFKEVAA